MIVPAFQLQVGNEQRIVHSHFGRGSNSGAATAPTKMADQHSPLIQWHYFTLSQAGKVRMLAAHRSDRVIANNEVVRIIIMVPGHKVDLKLHASDGAKALDDSPTNRNVACDQNAVGPDIMIESSNFLRQSGRTKSKCRSLHHANR